MGTAQAQGELWGARAQDWATLQEASMLPMYEAALAAAQVGARTRFLDAGCGAGLALQTAEKLGANVSGLDASSELIAIAKGRCPVGDIRVGEIEEMPFADDTFDVTTGFNSFQYAADPVKARRMPSELLDRMATSSLQCGEPRRTAN